MWWIEEIMAALCPEKAQDQWENEQFIAIMSSKELRILP